MFIEIERKFLLCYDGWCVQIECIECMVQGYLVSVQVLCDGIVKVLVCVCVVGDCVWFNIKVVWLGIEWVEFEYVMLVVDVEVMLGLLCDGVLVKQCYYVIVDGMLFEIDEFEGDNVGLIVVEVELLVVDVLFLWLDWLGVEVSVLLCYYNVNLIVYFYVQWMCDECDVIDGELFVC